MNAVKEKAYAKINLYLDISAKREDGFHEIATVMHSVSLCDEITVTVIGGNSGNIRLFLDGNRRLPTDSKNLAYSAARLFLDTAGKNADITIKLTKNIPISSGLAGGSSDAAAVLRALNKIFRRPFTDKMLLDLAARLGSDVPYCLLGGTAFCYGRGERIERLTSALELHVVIALGNERVSTPEAYSSLDRLYSNFDGSVGKDGASGKNYIIESIKSGSLRPEPLYNIFEGAILGSCPEASMIKNEMYSLGATHALMSGSGPSVFGVFKSEGDAKRACAALNEKNITAHYAKTVN